MRINKIFESFATSKVGQKVYKWACEPKSEKFLNNNLPQIETILSTACYVWSTSRQKNIDKEQRDLLQIQNIGSGILGVGVGAYLNRKVGKYTEKVIKDLDTTKIDPKSIRKISTGLRVGLPILTTAVLMRLVTPTVLAFVSGKMMDKKRENQKLDTKG